jgi:hypothetical protein
MLFPLYRAHPGFLLVRILLFAGLFTVTQLEPSLARTGLKTTANRVVAALQAGDRVKLAEFVHPSKGVRFSPYQHIETTDVVLFAKQVTSKANKIYLWGEYDGSGDSIELSFDSYCSKFVYDRDYVHAPKITRNGVLGSGNITNNLREIYPQSTWVEYHFPSAPGEMDWTSLWLIFEHYRGAWFLVGIAHGAWTI